MQTVALGHLTAGRHGMRWRRTSVGASLRTSGSMDLNRKED